jgi:hypothetical protein
MMNAAERASSACGNSTLSHEPPAPALACQHGGFSMLVAPRLKNIRRAQQQRKPCWPRLSWENVSVFVLVSLKMILRIGALNHVVDLRKIFAAPRAKGPR